MDIEAFSKTKIGQPFVKMMAVIMESQLRYRLSSPVKIIQGAEIRPGQNVLEIGCGTGFFTIPAARMIGDKGCLVAMDMLSISVEAVSRKVQAAGLKNVRVLKGDALNTQLETGSMDAIIVFGVIPAPMIPMDRLLTEMHRILKPGGTMAVWPPIPVFLPKSIVQSGLFTYTLKRNGVYSFMRIPRGKLTACR